jgi:hypothetical protein
VLPRAAWLLCPGVVMRCCSGTCTPTALRWTGHHCMPAALHSRCGAQHIIQQPGTAGHDTAARHSRLTQQAGTAAWQQQGHTPRARLACQLCKACMHPCTMHASSCTCQSVCTAACCSHLGAYQTLVSAQSHPTRAVTSGLRATVPRPLHLLWAVSLCTMKCHHHFHPLQHPPPRHPTGHQVDCHQVDPQQAIRHRL